MSSIKSFVGIKLHPNWLNACNLRFASNVGLSYNVGCSDLKKFANSGLKAENFKSFSQSVEHFFLRVGQNNFGNKIPCTCNTPLFFAINTRKVWHEC